MKHWSEFIPKRTQATKRLAKISNSLLFDVEQKKIELKVANEAHQENEQEIINKLGKHYRDEMEFKRDLEKAITQAGIWNNTPVLELNNPNNKNN